MTLRLPVVSAAAALLLAGPAMAADNPLAGTRWRLVEIQSMDDSVGSTRPEDPSRFTMQLNEDGTLYMTLDCNRADGTWKAEPSADQWNGGFGFGPLTTTKARCAPPRIDEMISVQAPYFRGYLLKNGRLYLSLMADGGIYAWEPDEPEIRFETAADPALEAAIRSAAPDYTQASVGILGSKARYLYGKVDLDDDGRPEVLAYMLGSVFCGTGGCNLMLFRAEGDGYRLINDFPATDLPVIVPTARTEGWNDLVRLQTGGGMPASYVRHVFDGEKYVEAERLPGNLAPSGTRILAGEFVFDDGIVVEPEDGPPEPSDAEDPATGFHATGFIPCARQAGQPLASCQFGVVREGDGTGRVEVFWPGGGKRVILFAKGTPESFDASPADGDARMTVEKVVDLYMIRIGDQRFEIPEVVILGDNPY